MRRQTLLALIIVTLFTSALYSQIDTLRIATYNVLNFPGTNWDERKPHFQNVIDAMQPDILAIQEVNDQTGVDSFLVAILNKNQAGRFKSAPFIDEGALNSALFYDASKFHFKSSRAIDLNSRDVIEYVLNYSNAVGDPDIYIYSAHLSAGAASADKADRAGECRILRDELNALPANVNFFVLGDFNFYTQSEVGFHTLIDSEADDDGRCYDPIDTPAVWHDKEIYAFLHTQCPRKERFGGGAYGGLDDRFDFIFASSSMLDNADYYYLPGSYQAFGNDGAHFNISIKDGANAAVSVDIADALYYASDHLPVCMDVVVDFTPLPVELVGFAAHVAKNSVRLQWNTKSETNNYGFQIERKKDFDAWLNIGFVAGQGTTLSENGYTFEDKNLANGSYNYRLQQIDTDGSSTYSEAIAATVNLVSSYMLFPNYPNPFNSTTRIQYQLPRESHVEIMVYDVLGNEIKTLLDGTEPSGLHHISWDGKNNKNGLVESGLYLCVMKSQDFMQSDKLLLIK